MTTPWEHILITLEYNDQASFELTADSMKECGKTWKGTKSQFEPRLLTYHTCANARPDIFKQKGLCILPIQNGRYLLTKQSIYYPLSYPDTPILDVVRDKSSLLLSIGQSETSLLDNLRYAGVFERPEFLGEPIRHGPLLNGRHRCSFSMTFAGAPVEVQGVQYEVDACYESHSKILLIEGKSSAKPIDSLNIRQLYYPSRVIHDAVQGKKEVISLFVHEYKGIVYIWKFTFANLQAMDSLTQTGVYRFKLKS